MRECVCVSGAIKHTPAALIGKKSKKKRSLKWNRLAANNKPLNEVTLFIVREEQWETEGVQGSLTLCHQRSWLTAAVFRKDIYLAGTLWARMNSLTCLKSCGLCTSTGLHLFLTHYTQSAYLGPLLHYWQNSAETHTHTYSEASTFTHEHTHKLNGLKHSHTTCSSTFLRYWYTWGQIYRTVASICYFSAKILYRRPCLKDLGCFLLIWSQVADAKY